MCFLFQLLLIVRQINGLVDLLIYTYDMAVVQGTDTVFIDYNESVKLRACTKKSHQLHDLDMSQIYSYIY